MSTTKTTLEERLRTDTVVLEANEHNRTGAQAIAPDHVARPAYAAGALPARSAAAVSAATLAMQHRVQQFLFYQSELLDGKHWGAYIDLFAAEGLYWMPATAEQTSWEDEPSIFAEDKSLMQVRMERLTHPNAWSQAPVWMTSHIVGNAVVESAVGAELVVRSRFQAAELRRDTLRQFVGTYRHVLREDGGDFKIVQQRVDLVNGSAAFDYVIQAWL
jgi:3-phenylpropionate/cinnamic acid dioxygenase small subunit